MASLVPMYSCSLVRDGSIKAESRMGDCARSVAPMFRAVVGDSDREHFMVAALSARRSVIGIQVVSVGTLSASLVHPREVFKPAILLNAASAVVAHNHPSGDCQPSAEDRDVTRRLQRAGELLGIPVADHIVLGEGETFYSFREMGVL